MSDDLVMLLRTAAYLAFEDGTNDYTTPALAAAEITRLRAALATARREGMEEAAKIAIARGWRNERLAAAIRAAAKEGKP